MIERPENLYDLLPAIYRIRDAENGWVLRALVTVLAKQGRLVEKDIAALYENWFIETCDDWVVPYLGDLLGVRGLHAVSGTTFSLRARVAHTLAYRRRKGTAPMLEQLAHDSTGWPARAVEFFELLHWTQNCNHLRPHGLSTPDLRRTDILDCLDTPFDRIAHSADVRRIASGRGRHNIPNAGLFFWRLENYPLSAPAGAVAARRRGAAPNGRFTFNPLGIDGPLFNQPQIESESDISHLAEEINLPAPLRRRPLYDELEARRQALADGQTAPALYFGTRPVFRIFINGNANPVQPQEILICDLSDWRVPAPTKTYRRANHTTVALPIRAAVDPKLGRIRFPVAENAKSAWVDYFYGFSGDLGGGPYNRSASIAALRTLDGRDALLDRITWRAGVSQTRPPVANTIFAKLADAVDAWNLMPPGTIGAIAILDSRTYFDQLTGLHEIRIAENSQLLLFAGDLPVGKPLEEAVPRAQRPHLRRAVSVHGTAPANTIPGELILHGLLFERPVTVAAGNLGGLRLQHCTLAPSKSRLVIAGTNDELLVRLERTICGAVRLASVPQLQVEESIVDGGNTPAIQASGARADLQASTFLGEINVRQLEAGNSIFIGKAVSTLRQAGCVRFCFVPGGSITPRRYRCQPDLALQGVSDPALENAIRLRIRPAFTSDDYGQPGYAQLKRTVLPEISAGADDGAEMGAFRFLQQPQREANLNASLDEYLRFGLEAGTFFVT